MGYEIILEEVEFVSCQSLGHMESETVYESATSLEVNPVNPDAAWVFDNLNLKVGSYRKRKMTEAEISDYLDYLERKKEVKRAARKEVNQEMKEEFNDHVCGCAAYLRYFSKRFTVSLQVKMRFVYRLLGLCCCSIVDPEPRLYSYQVSEDKTKHVVLLH